MSKILIHLVGLFVAILAAGCATPKIDVNAFPAPKTVVIDDFPDVKSIAIISGVITTLPRAYFSQPADKFFVLDGKLPSLITESYSAQADQIAMDRILNPSPQFSPTMGVVAGAVGGAVGALIQATAEATMKKAVDFPVLVRNANSNADLRIDLLKAVRESLEAKGVSVRISSETRNLPPRLRWLAKNEDGEALMTGPLVNSPPLEADMLIQLSPIAVYAAGGPLNPFKRRVGIGLAIFNGRTRQFIGWQAFPYIAPDDKFEYHTYDGMVEDLNQASPALHHALLSLVPDIVKVISGGR